MFAVPVIVTLLCAAVALVVAAVAFIRFYLPRMGLNLKNLHEMGEQYEKDLKSFAVLVLLLCLVMLAFLIAAIVITNRFLTRFVLRRIQEPLELLSAGVERVRAGDLETPICYERDDEFRPVCEAVNLMSERLAASASREEAEAQSRRELFAGISHDLRSPLTSVRAYTEALLDGVAQTPEDVRRYLMTIRKHEADLERMVGELFLYSKMELRDYPVKLQPLDLAAELARITEENPMEGLAVDLAGVPPLTVLADRELLERVVVNLMENSRKYRERACATVTFSAKKEDGMIRLCVADDGPGVPEELLPRLFDAFYRTDPARRNPAGGSGLGLAIVRRAMERMGGRVSAETRTGGGLAVTLYLQGGSEKCQES